jgi:integrase
MGFLVRVPERIPNIGTRQWVQRRCQATHIFINERGAPMSPDGFRKMLERMRTRQRRAGYPEPQQYLAHKNIEHTARRCVSGFEGR